ncbi:MAG: DUF6531 domain-containing protein [Holophagales bacterium]|nr:DUF6531 domain-containing protein [Holophagales bacterium]
MKACTRWILLFLLCLPPAATATVRGEHGAAPPTPPGMAAETYSGPSKAFQIRSTHKDSVGFLLSAGWNLISLPLEPYDTQIESVLAAVTGSFDQVWAYDGCAAGGTWRFFDPADAVASDLASLDHRHGFWIHMTADALLTVDGDPPLNTDTPVCTGWNLLGYPRNAPLPPQGALVSIAGVVDRVFGFEPGPGSPWRFWGATTPSWVHDLETLDPGHGYWVLATADATFTSVSPEPPPVIGSLDLLEGQEITAPTPITAAIDTTADVHWTLAHRPEGEESWLVFASGDTPDVDGELDPTLLLNGIYEIRLEVHDVFGQTTSAEGNVIVEGAMKPGVVTLTYPDMAVPMAGLPITVLRTYDSRDKRQGDFGYGWSLELARGTYRNNRPPGEGWYITLSDTVGQPPCSSSLELLTHFTDIRLGDQGFFRFALAVDSFGFSSQVNGGCSGEARFVQTGGRPGATLHILGNTEVWSGGGSTDLVDALTYELYEPQRVLLTTPEGFEYVLDLDDGVQQISGPDGASVTFAHNGIHHSDGRSIFFERDAEGRIRYLIDPAGQTVSYTYDEEGDLVAVTDLLGETTHFEYLAGIPHHLANILDEQGQITHAFDYDEGGRLAFTCPGGGDCTEMQHDVDNRTEVVYSATGHPTTFLYDEQGNVVTQTDALGNTTTLAYDPEGRLLSVTDALGGVTSYGYDERGNLITTTEPHDPAEPAADYTVTRAYDAQDRITAIDLPTGGGYRFTYAGGDREAEITDHEGNVIVAFGYDGSGRLISETGPFGTVSHVLDPAGNVVQSTDVFGRQASMTYDVLNQLTSMVDHDGQTSSYDYDPRGRETRADYGDGLVFEFEYEGTKGDDWTRAEGPTTGTVERLLDDRGRMAGWNLASGGEVRFSRDPAGRLLEQTDPLGGELGFAYDPAGRLESSTDARGGTATFSRDALGRVVATTDALGHTSQTSYGPDGRVIGRIDALGRAWEFSSTPVETVVTDPLGRESRALHSALGLPETWIFADGTQRSAEYLLTSTLLEAEQFPTRLVDEAGEERQLAYDNFGRLASVSDELQAATTYSYGEQLLMSITGPTGESRSFTYDEYGNVSTETLEDGGVSTFQYGEDLRLAAETKPSGAYWQYFHDEAGRLLQRQASSGETATLAYNLADQPISVSAATGTTSYSYDVDGSLAGIAFPDGSSIEYQRDLLGRIVSQTVSAPAVAPLVTTYAHDAVGNLVSVTDPLGGVTTWTYDEVDRPTTRTLPNGITTTWTYDLRDRILSIQHRDAADLVLASVSYERAVTGQPTQITWQDGARVELFYDAALRLVGERYFAADGALEEDLTYGYDPLGNRTSRVDALGVSSYSYAPGSRLSAVTGATAESYAHDADGRLVSMDRDGASRALTFDADDRLVSVEEDGAILASYVHDASQRRVAAASAAGERRFLVAPTNSDGLESPHLITDGIGNLAAAFVWAGSEALMRFGPAGPSYYLTDGMGSVIALADAGGSVTTELRYDGFGNLRLALGAEAQAPGDLGGDFRFHGHWLEEATGFYHVRARDYDPRTGLFLSRDPAEPNLARPETLHPYLFAEANPYLYADPTGLFTLMSINASISSLNSTETIKAGLAQQISRMAREEIGEAMKEILFDFFKKAIGSMFPETGTSLMSLIRNGKDQRAGDFFEDTLSDFMCQLLNGTSVINYVYREVQIKPSTGRALDNGQNCAGQAHPSSLQAKNKQPNPDFLVSGTPPRDQKKLRKKSWIVGDFKLTASKIGLNRPRQVKAIVNHARNYVYGKGILYITWKKGNAGDLASAIKFGRFRGTFPFIVVILSGF